MNQESIIQGRTSTYKTRRERLLYPVYFQLTVSYAKVSFNLVFLPKVTLLNMWNRYLEIATRIGTSNATNGLQTFR